MGNVSGKREEAESSGSFKIEDEDEDEDEEYMECTNSTGGDYHMQHALYPKSTQHEDEEYMECTHSTGGDYHIQHALYPESTQQVPLIPSERTGGNVMINYHAEMPIDNGIPTMITWHYDGNHVAIEGSWDHWKTREFLKRNGKEFNIMKMLESGVYRYRFIVDGHYRFDPDLPQECDESGNVFNLLDLQRTDSCERIMGKNKNKRGGRGRNKRGGRRRIQHYDWKQKILLVGEGDFSFSACLAKAFGSANNLVATCLHSQEMLQEKHWTSVREVQAIEARGGLVFYEVDVSIMNRHPDLKGYKFDIIIFNFPHAGHLSWLCERDQQLIRKHKKLIRAYFRSAKEMLEEAEEIHITLRLDPPYDSWEVDEIARKAGLHLKEKVEFIQANYPGYHNKRGSNIDCNKKFPLYCCYTFKFILPKPKGSSVESVLTTLKKLQI